MFTLEQMKRIERRRAFCKLLATDEPLENSFLAGDPCSHVAAEPDACPGEWSRADSAESQRVNFGWPQVLPEQRAENLDANLDEFCDKEPV